MFAIDPSSVNFTDGEISFVAEGRSLYKCKDWNFTAQTCFGSWVKLMDTISGQEYNITIDPYDPGFAEMGVASINTNKSRYHINESVKITMVVLNTSGYLVEAANVSLEVGGPNGTKTYFSTENFTILEVEKGIYVANFSKTFLSGNYSLYVEANGVGVNNSMYSEFLVEDYYEFDILRSMPVTIDPWQGPYQTNISFVSYNLSGTFNFTEFLPSNFTVNDSGGGQVSYSNESVQIEWFDLSNLSSISYTANAPLVTPDLYEIGPSRINYSGGIFDEARGWFLAIDPILTVINTTTGVPTDPSNVSAEAGNITELMFGGSSITQSWQGYFGNVTGVIELKDFGGNIFYNWSEASPEGEVLASRSSGVDFNDLGCANNSEILAEEILIGQLTSDADSISNTFNQNNHPLFYIGNSEFLSNTCNSTNLFDESGAQTTKFFEVLLADSASSFVYTSLLEEDLSGFDNRSHDFEMMVGEDGHNADTSATTYYFYVEVN